MAEGTPEAVAASERSYTGRYLGPLLARQAVSVVEAGVVKVRRKRVVA